MSVETWIAGTLQGLTWSSDIGSAFVGVVNGNAIISGTAIDNSSAKDIFCDVSYVATASVTTVAPALIGLFLYPLNADGTTYGDGQFGSSAGGPPPASYGVGSIVTSKIGATTTVTGVVRGIILPPGQFKFVFHNQTGATIPASTIKYRTYNLAVT